MSKRYTDDPDARGPESREEIVESERRETISSPLSDLKGKAILSIDSGEKLGTIDDILIDVANMRVAAIVSSFGPILNKEKRILQAGDVATWGRDAVLVKDVGTFRSEAEVTDRDKWVSTSNRLKGLSIVSTSGNKLGKVNDLMVDPDGRIVAYRVSEGTFGSHTRDIDASTTKSIGSDAVIVESENVVVAK